MNYPMYPRRTSNPNFERFVTPTDTTQTWCDIKCLSVFRVVALRKSWIKGMYQKIYFLETLLRLVLQLKCWIFRSVLMARNRPTWHFGTELKLISTTSLRPYYRASSPPSPSVTYYGFQSPHGHVLCAVSVKKSFPIDLSTNL